MKRLTIILTILAISIIFAQGAYAGMDDRSDRLSNEQSGVFSPGYINAAKQRTDAIINQMNPPKQSFMQRAMEYVKDKLSNKVAEDNADKPRLELKKKTGGGEESVQAKQDKTCNTIMNVESPEGTVLITKDYAVNIGSGVKPADEGRMIYEYINGVKHIYVGFADVGYRADTTTNPIQQAIEASKAGDLIIVHAGTYNGGLTLRDHVRLYGGFNDAGVRDVLNNKTYIVRGDIVANGLTGMTELNGFYLGVSPMLVDGKLTPLAAINVTSTSSVRVALINNTYASTIVTSNNGNVKISSYFGITGPLTVTGDFSFGSYFPAVTNIGRPKETMLVERTVNETGFSSKFNDLLLDYKKSTDSNSSYTVAGYNGSSSSVNVNSTNDKNINLLQKGNDGLLPLKTGSGDGRLAIKDIKDLSDVYALAIPISKIINSGNENVSLKDALASLLGNLTEDQKLMLDAVQSLVDETKKMEGQSQSPELKKASDDLLQMVAAVLIAQAIPDLFKETDALSIKSMFQELNASKGRIVLEYQESTKPYYNEVVKELSKNMSLLQLQNILNNSMTKAELEKLPRNEIDKILQKLKDTANKTEEMNIILKNEEEARTRYLDPSKKLLEEQMKAMMNDFTQRLSKVLEAKGVAKK